MLIECDREIYGTCRLWRSLLQDLSGQTVRPDGGDVGRRRWRRRRRRRRGEVGAAGRNKQVSIHSKLDAHFLDF